MSTNGARELAVLDQRGPGTCVRTHTAPVFTCLDEQFALAPTNRGMHRTKYTATVHTSAGFICQTAAANTSAFMGAAAAGADAGTQM